MYSNLHMHLVILLSLLNNDDDVQGFTVEEKNNKNKKVMLSAQGLHTADGCRQLAPVIAVRF